MLDWNSIICFCEVARSGNFSSSAKTQNMSVAILTRKINSLEKQNGVDLFIETLGNWYSQIKVISFIIKLRSQKSVETCSP